MLTMDYTLVGKDVLKLKTSNRHFSEGGLSVHVFDEPGVLDDNFELKEGLNTFDLVFTLTYLNMDGGIHNEACANLEPTTLNVEVRGDEILVSIPYFEGNLPKERNWGDDWQVESWTTHSYFIASSSLHPDNVISRLVNDRFKFAQLDLSHEFLLKYLEKSLVFKKDNEYIGFSIKYEEPKEK